MNVQNAPASLDMAGKGLLRHNVTFVKSNRDRAVQPLRGENFKNRGKARNTKGNTTGNPRHNLTFVPSNRDRAAHPKKGEIFQNRGNTGSSRHFLRVGSNSRDNMFPKFTAQRSRRRRKRGRRKSRRMRTLSKRKNPAAAEQRVMSLQNLLRSRFLSQKSKSLLQTPAAPTKEEVLIKVTPAFVL